MAGFAAASIEGGKGWGRGVEGGEAAEEGEGGSSRPMASDGDPHVEEASAEGAGEEGKGGGDEEGEERKGEGKGEGGCVSQHEEEGEHYGQVTSSTPAFASFDSREAKEVGLAFPPLLLYHSLFKTEESILPFYSIIKCIKLEKSMQLFHDCKVLERVSFLSSRVV